MFWSIVWGIVVGGILLAGCGVALLILLAAILKAAEDRHDA